MLQDAVLQEGGLEQLVAASAAMEPGLRRSGVWAMQNLAHGAQLPVKLRVLMALPWPAVAALLSDPEPDVQVGRLAAQVLLPTRCRRNDVIGRHLGSCLGAGSTPAALCRQEHTFTLLRNLVHGGATHARAVMAWAADQGNLGSGAANLLAALAAPLQPGAPSTPGQREQALFAVCNVCAGAQPHLRLPPSRCMVEHGHRWMHACRRLAVMLSILPICDFCTLSRGLSQLAVTLLLTI